MNPDELKSIIEGALFAAGRALSIEQIQALFDEAHRPDAGSIKSLLDALYADYADRGVELRQVASGWRFQVRHDVGRG